MLSVLASQRVWLYRHFILNCMALIYYVVPRHHTLILTSFMTIVPFNWELESESREK